MQTNSSKRQQKNIKRSRKKLTKSHVYVSTSHQRHQSDSEVASHQSKWQAQNWRLIDDDYFALLNFSDLVDCRDMALAWSSAGTIRDNPTEGDCGGPLLGQQQQIDRFKWTPQRLSERFDILKRKPCTINALVNFGDKSMLMVWKAVQGKEEIGGIDDNTAQPADKFTAQPVHEMMSWTETAREQMVMADCRQTRKSQLMAVNTSTLMVAPYHLELLSTSNQPELITALTKLYEIQTMPQLCSIDQQIAMLEWQANRAHLQSVILWNEILCGVEGYRQAEELDQQAFEAGAVLTGRKLEKKVRLDHKRNQEGKLEHKIGEETNSMRSHEPSKLVKEFRRQAGKDKRNNELPKSHRQHESNKGHFHGNNEPYQGKQRSELNQQSNSNHTSSNQSRSNSNQLRRRSESSTSMNNSSQLQVYFEKSTIFKNLYGRSHKYSADQETFNLRQQIAWMKMLRYFVNGLTDKTLEMLEVFKKALSECKGAGGDDRDDNNNRQQLKQCSKKAQTQQKNPETLRSNSLNTNSSFFSKSSQQFQSRKIKAFQPQKDTLIPLQPYASQTDCKICFWSHYDDTNKVLYCDRCNTSYHMLCYNLSIQPQGDEYYCDGCVEVRERQKLREKERDRTKLKDKEKEKQCMQMNGREGSFKEGIV